MDDINQRQHPHPTVEYLLLSNDFGYYSLNVSEIRRNFRRSSIYMELLARNVTLFSVKLEIKPNPANAYRSIKDSS